MSRDSEIITRETVDLTAIERFTIGLVREMYVLVSQAEPEAIHLGQDGFPVIKQRPDFHSYSIAVHNRQTGGILQWISDSSFNQPTPVMFTNPGTNGLVEKIYSTEDAEEDTLRCEILERSQDISRIYHFSEEEIQLQSLGGYLHDIGKFFEPEVKYMENTATHGRTLRIKRQLNGRRLTIPNPACDQFTEQQHLYEFKGTHFQDNLTLLFYKKMRVKGIISKKSYLQLSLTHKIFTYLSQQRYDTKINDWDAFLDELGDRREVAKAVLLLVADEIGKGRVFIDDPEGNSTRQRIEKYTNILTILRQF